MARIIKKLRVLLDKKQKATMAGLMILMVIGAFLQTAGVGLLVQAVNVVIDPGAVEKNGYVRAFYELLGSRDFQNFSVTVMVLLVVVFGVKNLFLFVQQKLTFAFVYANQFRTSERMLRNYLRRGYEFYLNADTAVVQRSITSDVNNMYALILALLQLLSDGVVSLFVVSYCLMANGVMTMLLAFALVLLMAVIKKVLKPIMHKAGEDNQNYYSSLFKWISQTVQGIKEIKIICKEQYFVDEYQKCGRGYVNAVQRYSLYNNVPKLLIETVCIAVMMGYMIVLTVTGVSTENMLEVFSTLAAAAFVLLPAVKLRDITYAYPNTEKLIFDHADLTIEVGSAVGIVGTSGAGKSTIVDVLLGLLEVKSGSICADGVDVKTNYRAFLKNIGYIPQMIFMLDDTIRKNVAFGVHEEEIDEARVWEVLREAQLDEFVRSLPEGLDTGIGERGIRLSGGQRQRIGIARALYYDPEVLILDEATSALDNDTEGAIMDSINRLHGKKTLVIIAHRLQTIEKCDAVYRVEEGKIRRERSGKEPCVRE